MSIFLTLASLFFVGSVLGWVLELLFRNIVHKNKKWVNPGFCTGPNLPIYGFGLCTLYLLASLEKYGMITNPLLNKLVLFAAMAVGLTLIEYIAGLFCLKYFKVMLWDYSDQWGNIQGLICPLFSFFWAVLGALYYFLIHPYILGALDWLARNLAFSFFIECSSACISSMYATPPIWWSSSRLWLRRTRSWCATKPSKSASGRILRKTDSNTISSGPSKMSILWRSV